MKIKPFRILCWFDYVATTGFSTVSQNLMARFRKYYGDNMHVDILAINYFGERFRPDPLTDIIPATKADETDKGGYGRYAFLNSIEYNDYDLVFTINDLGVVRGFWGEPEDDMLTKLKILKAKKIKENRKWPKLIWYFPVDSPPFDFWCKGLEFFDALVTYTNYGKDEVVKQNPLLKTKIKVIYHGVNEKHFYPMEDKDRKYWRKEYFGEAADKFIIGNINRNQFRKNIPRTILAFAEFKKVMPNTFLYLHMANDDHMGWDLRRICYQVGLKEGRDFMLPADAIRHAGASIEMLNAIYNSLDAYLTTTTGEGWGLSLIEAMACKIPVVAPMHTSISEIAGEMGEGRIFEYDACETFVSRYDSTVRFETIEEDIVEALNKVFFYTPRGREAILQSAFDFTQTITWDFIADQWIELFNKLL